MMRYTFWYGTQDEEDLGWMTNAVELLVRDEWDADNPVYIDGASFAVSPIRRLSALRLLRALRTNKSARALIVHNTILTPQMRRALLDVFEQNASLETIRLRNVRCDNNNDGGGGHRPFVVPAALASRRGLSELCLDRCNLDTAGSVAMAEMLSDKTACELRGLTLQDVRFDSTLDLTRLLGAIGGNSSLSELYLEKLRLNESHATDLARMLRSNKHLTKVSLRRNHLNGAAIEILMTEGLRCSHHGANDHHHGRLQSLCLSHNPIGDAGALHIVAALQQRNDDTAPPSGRRLQELCLVQSRIGPAGCLEIARGLGKFHHLRKLCLDGNQFGQCAAAFLASLRENTTIVQILEAPAIFMTHNSKKPTGASGGGGLIGALGKDWRRVDLYLRWNKANRRALGEEPDAPVAFWPRILEGTSCQPDVLFQFLSEKPELLFDGCSTACNHSQHQKQPVATAAAANAHQPHHHHHHHHQMDAHKLPLGRNGLLLSPPRKTQRFPPCA